MSRVTRETPGRALTELTEITVRYFAYGSNLNVAQMAQRCPGAKPLGCIKLPGWKLVFRGVADAIQEPGAFCYGGIWRITPEDEAALEHVRRQLAVNRGDSLSQRQPPRCLHYYCRARSRIGLRADVGFRQCRGRRRVFCEHPGQVQFPVQPRLWRSLQNFWSLATV